MMFERTVSGICSFRDPPDPQTDVHTQHNTPLSHRVGVITDDIERVPRDSQDSRAQKMLIWPWFRVQLVGEMSP